MSRTAGVLSDLCQFSLAVMSFLFYKVIKFSIRFFLELYALVRGKQATKWRPLSADTFANPLALPVIMTIGPRWNTHAILATAGPLHVKDSLTIDVASAEKSSRSWTIVVFSLPGHRAVTNISSLNSPFENGSASLRLSPGRYWIGLRYYQWSNIIELPAVRVDGVITLEPKHVRPDVNDFYLDLVKKNNFFYLCLHYYVFVLLQIRKQLSESFVEREFLPVGNPATKFHYGVLRQGESLCIELSSSLLTDYDVYLTFYNLASFPIEWYQVTQDKHVTSARANNCSYLIRIHKSRSVERRFDESSINLSVRRSV